MAANGVHTKIYSLSCHSRCWAQGQIIVFSSLLESCQAYCIVNCIMIWLIFRDNHVLYHGKLYCCSLVTNGFFYWGASWFVIMCAIFAKRIYIVVFKVSKLVFLWNFERTQKNFWNTNVPVDSYSHWQFISFFPNFHVCFYGSIDLRSNFCLFLIKN